MYESLRPTNVLKDAANNTSLQPLDLVEQRRHAIPDRLILRPVAQRLKRVERQRRGALAVAIPGANRRIMAAGDNRNVRRSNLTPVLHGYPDSRHCIHLRHVKEQLETVFHVHLLVAME
jgi:hypothetical protein